MHPTDPAAPGTLDVARQAAELTVTLRGALEEQPGDDQAAALPAAAQAWARAEPESRAAVLLNLAWASRDGQLPEDDDGQAHAYAAELHRTAREFVDPAEAFYGPRYPAMPLPGRAGTLASTLAFDRADLPISLACALLLLAAVPTNVLPVEEEPADEVWPDDDRFRTYGED